MAVDLDTQPTKIQTKVEIRNKKTRITHIGKPCELALRSAFAPSPSLFALVPCSRRRGGKKATRHAPPASHVFCSMPEAGQK
jgi:hypothetical protein